MEYTPDQVDWFLKNWLLVESLAESPSTSVHLLSPECRHSDKACGSGKPVGIKSTRSHGDPVRYCDVKADLEQSAQLLPPYSLESRVVARRISTGARMPEIRAQLGCNYTAMWQAYRSACRMMAKSLGWKPDEKSKAEGSAGDPIVSKAHSCTPNDTGLS